MATRAAVLAEGQLSYEQAEELAERAQAGDEEAKERLIRACEPLVQSVASRYHLLRMDRDDLIQEGNLALLRAIRFFDPRLGHFFYFAKIVVIQNVRRAIAEQNQLIRPNQATVQDLISFRDQEEALRERFKRQPTLTEIAAGLGTDLEDARTTRSWLRRSFVDLDRPVDGDGSLHDLIAGGESAESEVIARQNREWILAQIDQALERHLTERARYIVRSRFGLNGPPRTLAFLARELGINASAVAQTQWRALQKLRRVLPPGSA